MTDTEITIVEAAWRVFARYGFKKTTMSDIAGEADVSRQTVYNAFPGKTEILRAVVTHANCLAVEQISAEWSLAPDLPAKLDIYIQHGPISWYDTIMAMPDSADMLDSFGDKTTEEWRQINALWLQAFKDTFAASNAISADPEMSLEEIADLFYWSTLNAKYGATDRAHFLRRLKAAHAATLALLA